MTSLLYKHQKTGFTLIELLVTVLIMVIALSIGMINYIRYLQKQELYKSGSQIESVLKDARSKAQNGFLGDENFGYCAKLAAVEVLVTKTADKKILATSRLKCNDGSMIVYDSNAINDANVTLDKVFTISFLPRNGAELILDGKLVSSGSATLSRNDGQVIFTFDQGGTIDVKYFTNFSYLTGTPTGKTGKDQVDDDVVVH